MTYETSMFTKTVGYEARSYDELIGMLDDQIKWLRELQAVGVEMQAGADGHFTFVTEDVEVARRFEMLPWDY